MTKKDKNNRKRPTKKGNRKKTFFKNGKNNTRSARIKFQEMKNNVKNEKIKDAKE
jgi:hypothetical protein|tara:strand:- start:210 stop:374 length:165 start_codon:yes stop_codon:yes gene_type:complete